MSETKKTNTAAWIWLTGIILLFVMFCVGVCIYFTEKNAEKKAEDEANKTVYVSAPYSADECKDKNFEQVADDFENAGFTNVKTEAIEDLITGWLTKDGAVEKVSVGGNSAFSESETFDSAAEVIIIYHTFRPEIPNKNN